MAIQTLQEILAALAQIFAPELDRQFNRQCVLAEVLPKRVGAGKNIAWDVRFSRSKHAGSFAEGADVAADEFQTDLTVPATLGWGMYRSAFSVSGLAIAASSGSVGSALDMLDLFGSNLTDAASDLIAQINSALFLGDGTGSNVAGLFGAGAIHNTGVYANINRATHSAWGANVLANAGTARPLTKALLDQLEESIYIACGMMPDIIVCSPGTARAYESLFDSMAHVFVERGDVSALRPNVANVGGPVIPPNTGFTGLSYKGIPIYRDRDCPPGKLAMLNRQFVQIRTLPQVTLGTATMTREQELAGAPGNNTRIAARIDSLAKGGDSDRFQLVAYLQLQVRRPGACGVIDDLN